MNARPEHLTPAPAERYAFPASFAQQRLWFLEQLDGAGPVWNVRLPVRLRGALDVPALEQAVAAVVARHESLRTTFGMRGGEILQFVASTMAVPVERVAMRGATEDEVRRRLGELAAHSFDIREGRLLRVFLIEQAADLHVLLLLSHHIVSDAWSSGVLFQDLAAAYRAVVSGGQPVLPELAVQYADFAVWQREWLAGAELAQQLAFWRRHLASAPVFLDLPLDHPRPRLQTYKGNRTGRGLPPQLSAELKRLATAEGVTLFMLLFAAFNVLLARWSGQHDLVVGTPIAGRRRTELEGLVGFFANTLAIRTRVDAARDFRELLRQVRASALEAFTHQDLPFEKLVEALKPPRSLAHSPLFQVLFVLQNTPWEAGTFGDLEVSPAEIAAGGTARFDLAVSVSDYDGQLWLGLEYSTDLFDVGTIERLAAGFETLLAAIVAGPAAVIGTLPVQPYADRQRQLHDWQPSAAPDAGPPGGDVYSMFAAQARRTPDAIALECGGLRVDYAQLDARAGELAAQLHAAGMTGRTPVAICLERSPGMLVAILGVLRAGGHYLPLDPGHPPARLAFVLQDSGAGLLLTSAALADRFTDFGGSILTVSPAGEPSGATETAVAPEGAAAGEARGDAPAYLIYTSGSTGRPKGVVVPQRAVVNFLNSMASEPGLNSRDRLLAVTTPAFDIAVLELLLPLTVGATTVIASDDEVRDPARLIGLLDAGGITVMQATPATWRNLLAAGWGGRAGLRLYCGGEALDRDLANQLLPLGAGLWNLYGPTETTIWSCVDRVAIDDSVVPIGRPIASTRCYVLDEQLQPVPIGARGELWIGGDGVALGYHGQPELTAQRFQPDPFNPVRPGGRMYRTGDRARWLADGRLDVLGRTDFQLKLRGFRIEPGEVEAALLAHTGVREAVVVLREVAGDPRLVAYLAARDEPVADDELLAMLRQTLPAYMLPSTIVWLSALPVTPNGKVDRAALPSPVIPAEAVPAAAETAPTVAAQALLGIFRELLGAPVGLDDDFFARGGHSLLATRLIARVAGELRVTLPLRAVFEAPTVRGLAAALPDPSPAGAPPGATPEHLKSRLKPLLQEETAPLSLVQQRLWFLDRLQPGNAAYNLAWAFELRGALDRDALQSALDTLADRHGSLRTYFRERDGQPEQVIAAATGWPLQFVTAGAPDVAGVAADAAAAPFDLATGPLARALLIGSAPGVHTLLVVIHHIVADGWSLGVLTRELAVLYAAARRGEAVALPTLACDYAGYAREQRRALGGGGLARQLGYWKTQLRDAPPFLDLPTDRPRPALPSARGARYSRTLPAGLQAGLQALARAEGCTLFMVMLAAFDVLLARYTGAEDIVVGTPVAGRPESDHEGLVGFFVNTLVLRTDLGGNPTVRELLARVRGMTLDAYEHAEVPFELLVETLQPPRNTSRTPLFQVLFNLHSEPGVPLELAGLAVQPVAIPRHSAKFDLSVSLAETAAGIAVGVEYSTDLFLPASVERLVADYAVLLSGLVAAPDGRLTDLPFSPPAADAMLIVREDPVASAALTLPAAFAAQLARNPGALAVSAPATATRAAIDWSYAALAVEAAALAGALARRDVRAGDRVGLWFGHGAGQVAGILGVLQAGAVYVPLDPLAPPARLATIVRDAGLRVVVTDGEAPAWPLPGLAVVVMDELPREADAVAAVTMPMIHPDSLAYLLYTSGSTGSPKGVPQTHRNVLHFVRAWAGNLGIAPVDRLSLLSTAGYDAAVQDIFGALLTGASVCPLDVRRLDRETLLDRIADRGLTVLHGTPTVYRYLFGGHVACRQDLSRVRLVVLGGEAARRADFELFRARFGRTARFVNGYGLTEATAVTQWFAGKDTHPWGQQLPIGKPVAEGQRLQLLDDAGAPAPFVGEIVLDGAHVTPGYWPLPAGAASAVTLHSVARGPPAGNPVRLPWVHGERPDRTPAVGPLLRGNRVTAEAAPAVARQFHTGDLARYLPDGSLVYVGRRDSRLKIGGIRIEAGDIEAALRTHPAIDDAVALAPMDTSGEPVLVAWYTPRAGEAPPTVPALRAHLLTLLPAALVPARFIACEEFPRLPNGKVDRQALALDRTPAVGPLVRGDSVAPEAAATAAPAATETSRIEATLLDIWRTLLKLDRIGPDDDFFAIGGHSLLATRLVARVRDRLGIELPLIRIFDTPTVRGLAEFLASPRIHARRADE